MTISYTKLSAVSELQIEDKGNRKREIGLPYFINQFMRVSKQE